MNTNLFKNKKLNGKSTLCVISIETFGEYGLHDIQTSSAWGTNPYENYAVIPSDMVESIMETKGFCDIILNDEGTEVVSFTPREIPVIPEPTPEPTQDELQWQAITDLEIHQMEYDQALTDLEIAQLEGGNA